MHYSYTFLKLFIVENKHTCVCSRADTQQKHTAGYQWPEQEVRTVTAPHTHLPHGGPSATPREITGWHLQGLELSSASFGTPPRRKWIKIGKVSKIQPHSPTSLEPSQELFNPLIICKLHWNVPENVKWIQDIKWGILELKTHSAIKKKKKKAFFSHACVKEEVRKTEFHLKPLAWVWLGCQPPSSSSPHRPPMCSAYRCSQGTYPMTHTFLNHMNSNDVPSEGQLWAQHKVKGCEGEGKETWNETCAFKEGLPHEKDGRKQSYLMGQHLLAK